MVPYEVFNELDIIKWKGRNNSKTTSPTVTDATDAVHIIQDRFRVDREHFICDGVKEHNIIARQFSLRKNVSSADLLVSCCLKMHEKFRGVFFFSRINSHRQHAEKYGLETLSHANATRKIVVWINHSPHHPYI